MTEFQKGFIELFRAQLDQLLVRSSKVGYSARIPASITIATEERGLWEGKGKGVSNSFRRRGVSLCVVDA